MYGLSRVDFFCISSVKFFIEGWSGLLRSYWLGRLRRWSRRFFGWGLEVSRRRRSGLGLLGFILGRFASGRLRRCRFVFGFRTFVGGRFGSSGFCCFICRFFLADSGRSGSSGRARRIVLWRCFLVGSGFFFRVLGLVRSWIIRVVVLVRLRIVSGRFVVGSWSLFFGFLGRRIFWRTGGFSRGYRFFRLCRRRRIGFVFWVCWSRWSCRGCGILVFSWRGISFF